MGMANKGCDIHGLLIVDKPSGLSSSSVVRRLKRWSKAEKVGHTGALDPMATGVLPIVFGEAAKYSQYGLDSKKVILRASSSARQLTHWMQTVWWLLKRQSPLLTGSFFRQY